MTAFRGSVLLAMVLSLSTGCECQPSPKADPWLHLKQCTEQADRMAKKLDVVQGHFQQGSGGLSTVMSWHSHYSPKHDKCFIYVNYRNNSTEIREPRMYEELIDAFDGRRLVTCTNQTIAEHAKDFCGVLGLNGLFLKEGPRYDCDACRKWVDERMAD